MVDLSINERESRPDRLQLAALAVLMFIGTMFVFSATMANTAAARCRGMTRFGCGKSSGMRSASARAAAVCLMDYHTLARWSFVAYWATIFCLVAVLIPHIGSMHGGARGAGLIWGCSNFSRANLRSSRSFSRRQIF